MNAQQLAAPRQDNPSTGRKLRRYVLVTIVATPANLVLYLVWFFVVGTPALVANLAAATLVSIPTYVANRRWVWQLDSRSSTADAAQYWASTLCSVLCSSAALWVSGELGAGPVVLASVPLGVYAVLWLLRFWFLDQVLFNRRGRNQSTEAPVA